MASASAWARACAGTTAKSERAKSWLLRLAAAILFALQPLWPLPSFAQQRNEGERAYQKCYSCHSVDRAETNLSGPNLAGVIGRRAASLPGFDYSPAMKKAGAGGLVWTEEALDRYLADPLDAINGTSMSFPGLRSPAERRAVIEYLRRFR